MAVTLLFQSGCCLLFPDWPDCANPPNPATFTFEFLNERTDFCDPEFQPQWRVEFTDFEGETEVATGEGSDALVISTAADSNNNDFIDFAVIKINTTCNSDAEQDQWSILVFDGTIPVNGRVSVTLFADDELDFELGDNLTNAAGVPKKFVSNAKPVAKKSCCW